MGDSDNSARALPHAANALMPNALIAAADSVSQAMGYIAQAGDKYTSKYGGEFQAVIDRLQTAAGVMQQTQDNLRTDAAAERAGTT